MIQLPCKVIFPYNVITYISLAGHSILSKETLSVKSPVPKKSKPEISRSWLIHFPYLPSAHQDAQFQPQLVNEVPIATMAQSTAS